MTDRYIDLTLNIEDAAPIELSCKMDNPVLRQLCGYMAAGPRREDEIMYLEIGETEPRFLYFPARSLKSIESSSPLPDSLFRSPDWLNPEDYAELNLDPYWIEWVNDNLERGCHREDLFRVMYDAGVDYGVIETVLKYTPKAPLHIIERDDREPIEPLASVSIDGNHRLTSDYIELYAIKDFLSAEECDAFQSLVGENLRRSTVFDVNPISDSRTSYTYDFPNDESADPRVRALQNRLCDIFGIDLVKMEALQCQIYSRSQQFRAHQDYFNDEIPDYVGWDGVTRAGQRQWSIVIYLTDGEEGTGTRFPRIMQEFTPTKGTALIWNNLYPSGNANPYTLHAGLPAGKAQKMILTTWTRVAR